MVDLATVVTILSAASTIAVILGVPFILLQMRQNARMIEAASRQAELTAHQNRAQVLLSIAGQLTDRAFVLQRKTVRDIVAKHSANGWQGFLDSLDAYEVRALAIQYESIALTAKLGLIDRETLVQAIGFTVVIDWQALQPALAEFDKNWGVPSFPNFGELAAVSEKHWQELGRGSAGTTPPR